MRKQAILVGAATVVVSIGVALASMSPKTSLEEE